jgi:hypothetical protein
MLGNTCKLNTNTDRKTPEDWRVQGFHRRMPVFHMSVFFNVMGVEQQIQLRHTNKNFILILHVIF